MLNYSKIKILKNKLYSKKKNENYEIYTKFHKFLNPGGSPKDRAALSMIKDAEMKGLIQPNKGCTIFEGTSGSTGISIAIIAKAKGYNAWIIMPDDQAKEKYQLLEKLGATVEKVKPASIVDKNQFVNLAKRRAEEFGKNEEKDNDRIDGATGFFTDQFENLANYSAHYQGTGPELYRQTNGKIDAIVTGAGKKLIYYYYYYFLSLLLIRFINYRYWRNSRRNFSLS